VLKLHGRLARPWNENPFVVRLRRTSQPTDGSKDREAMLLGTDDQTAPPGYRVYLSTGLQDLPACTPSIRLPDALSYLTDGDIVRIIPRSSAIAVLYRKASKFNSILVTERCNSNCLMCSQPPKDVDDGYLVDAFLEAIPLMDAATPELGITGGEPTLLGDRLLQMIQKCKECLPATALHMLSNGRLFNYLSLCRKVAEIGHPDIMIGIPIYSDIADRHDFVVQAKGAFDQTIRGIVNLKRCGVRVEVRVVLHRQTVDRLPQLARFLTRNLQSVDHVALMGLEMMGYVKMNMDALWIDPFDYQAQLVDAVRHLAGARMKVSIYKHQLCVLHGELWSFTRKSISDWKNEYFEPCQKCLVNEKCGGFFASAKTRYSDHISPITSIA
jgi:His-Xaa-Ser system radical SAM maturase HxsC